VRTTSTPVGRSTSARRRKVTNSSSQRRSTQKRCYWAALRTIVFAKAWPSRQGEFADKFNSMPKYVISSTLKNPNWNNSTILHGDVAEESTKLKKRDQCGD